MRIHAFTDDVLAEHDAVALAGLVQRGEVSVAEITEAAIARAEKVEAKINAIEFPAFERARSAARRPASGVFAGVPTFVKDNADMKGYPTRNGSRAAQAHIASEDGRFTAQFLKQGFVVLGKSSLPEFGFNASTEFELDPPTRNPWNTEHSAGGSSGGSAALVAAGVVPIAHANDGGGSIRIPAACCGLIGLKPTRGRHMNNAAAASMPVNIVGEGVVTRSVRDTAVYFAGMEQVYQNAKLPAIGLVEGAGKKKLRIGLVIDSITGIATDAETRATVENTAKILASLGHHVEPMPLPVPPSFLEDFVLYWGFLAFLIATFGRFAVARDFDATLLDPLGRGLADYYRKNIWDSPAMLYRMFQTEKLYRESFSAWDAVLTPVLGHTVPRLGHLSPAQPFEALMERLKAYVAFTPLNNAAGSPAISLPMGVDRNGVPIGVQLQAAHGAERTLLELAFALEEAKPWPKIQSA